MCVSVCVRVHAQWVGERCVCFVVVWLGNVFALLPLSAGKGAGTGDLRL